jgi:hypothetical protein
MLEKDVKRQNYSNVTGRFQKKKLMGGALPPVYRHTFLRGRIGKVAFIHHESEGPGSIPRASTVDQASGVGKLVAVCKKRVTVAEDCDE